jgi:hypothetical protein
MMLSYNLGPPLERHRPSGWTAHRKTPNCHPVSYTLARPPSYFDRATLPQAGAMY